MAEYLINVLASDGGTSDRVFTQFMEWMDGGGEQAFWEHCDIRGEVGANTRFVYDYTRKAVTIIVEENHHGER